MLVTLETAVTAVARIGYMPVVRFNAILSPPGVVIVTDPLPALTNDNHSVAVGKLPGDDPSEKARFGALDVEAIFISRKANNHELAVISSLTSCQYVLG